VIGRLNELYRKKHPEKSPFPKPPRKGFPHPDKKLLHRRNPLEEEHKSSLNNLSGLWEDTVCSSKGINGQQNEKQVGISHSIQAKRKAMIGNAKLIGGHFSHNGAHERIFHFITAKGTFTFNEATEEFKSEFQIR
jgi:hypothetical protein